MAKESTSKYPPPFKTELQPIGGYGLDTCHCFEFSVDDEGFMVERHFGPPSPGDWFGDLGYFPSDSVWSMKRKRLTDLLNSLPKTVVDEVDSLFNRIWWFYGGALCDFLEEEKDKKGKALREVQNRHPEVMGLQIKIGPVTCKRAPEPDYCGAVIEFDDFDDCWHLFILGDAYLPEYEDPGQTSIMADTFLDLLAQKEDICLRWSDEEIIDTLSKADERWKKLIKRGRPYNSLF